MAPPPPAPPTRREEVVDTVHGERLADPYRWLEDDGSDRVREWTDAQNARTRTVLDAIPQRAHFARRIGEPLSVGLLETRRPSAGKIFHVRRAGAQQQLPLSVRDAGGATAPRPSAARAARRRTSSASRRRLTDAGPSSRRGTAGGATTSTFSIAGPASCARCRRASTGSRPAFRSTTRSGCARTSARRATASYGSPTSA